MTFLARCFLAASAETCAGARTDCKRKPPATFGSTEAKARPEARPSRRAGRAVRFEDAFGGARPFQVTRRGSFVVLIYSFRSDVSLTLMFDKEHKRVRDQKQSSHAPVGWMTKTRS